MTGIDWAHVYAEHYELVFRVVYNRVKSRPVAEDLTQETFIRAMRCERQWTDYGRGVSPWLNVIAQNIAYDHLKSSRVRLERATEDMAGWAREATPSAEDVALLALEAAELTWEVERAMADLTEPQQQALRLQYWAGQPFAAIADCMGRNVGAVKTLSYRGRQSLARQLSPTA